MITGKKSLFSLNTNIVSRQIMLVMWVFLSSLFTVGAAASVNSGKYANSPQEGPAITSVETYVLGDGIKAQSFYSGFVDENNMKWFLTDAGVINGPPFKIVIEGTKIPLKPPYRMAYEYGDNGQGIWFPTSDGVFLATLPFGADSELKAYDISNSGLVSNNVYSVTVGKSNVKWFATDKGISALYGENWLPNAYKILYTESMFREYPVTAMLTSHDGDSLYAATEGLGITRVFRNNIDAISGASQYAFWGPIDLPSDTIYCIALDAQENQWFGTSQGVARHEGFQTLEKWTVFNTKNGLVNNYVRSIGIDNDGNVWCGTKGGISVYDGNTWTSFTTDDGLLSNNILLVLTDNDGSVFFGTDNGLMIYNNGVLSCYQ